MMPGDGGNFGRGWLQLRKTYPGERRADSRVFDTPVETEL